MIQRPRRLRVSQNLRDMVAETTLTPENFIVPFFLVDGKNKKEQIPSLPGHARLSVDKLLRELEEVSTLGLKSILLFPALPEALKDPSGTEAINPQGLLPSAIRAVKKEFPELMVFSDIALDPYSSDGHDGIVKGGKILNDETVNVLAKMAVVHAEAGVDFVAPSDMMDGRVKSLRQAMDREHHTDVGIMSYTAKYASAFYGPFREALDSKPRAGDKKTYQMDFRNHREALKELKLDLSEGADLVMVKPALCYLDVISAFQRHSSVPVAAYNVSGEYAMIKWGAQHGAFDERQARDEMLYSIKRAGASLIASYFAMEFAREFR